MTNENLIAVIFDPYSDMRGLTTSHRIEHREGTVKAG
jgi:hypothetical protein